LTPFKLKQATPFLDTYTYDTRNRLTGHTSAQGASQKLNLVNAYDDNGNIERLTRTLLGTTVDNLGYTYNGNRLVSINETAVGDANPNYETFKPIASGNYGYDNAGTLTNDPYKGLTITNNFLHLPQQITGASVNVTNTYSSTGQKVKAVGPTGTYDYLGAVVFKNNEIEFVSTPEGRTLPPQAVKQNSMRYTPPYPQGDTTNLFWRYEYTLKDHLGNLRVACRCAEKHTDQQEDHTDGYAPTVVQQTHYDAWGVRLPLFGNDDPNYGKPHDRYRYNGKELVEGIGWYDYGARMYDPTIGRWSAIDPMAEKFLAWSSYAFSLNNPLRFIDPDGAAPLDVFKQGKDGRYTKVNNDGGNRTHTYINNNGTTSFYNVQTGTMQTVSEHTMLSKQAQYRAENKKQVETTLKILDVADNIGDGLSIAGTVLAPFTNGGSLSITAIGEGISLAAKAASHSLKFSTEGATTENQVDFAVDVAFEVLPSPIENSIKRSGLDEVSKKIIVAEIKQGTMATEKMVKGTIENSRKKDEQ
jgi:RHS repeat-associated protein